ncbi:hypothetical protein [Aureimonas sp. AU20]|uniref:hypothetical protein n=1 Tax=Aureimonas sp. AU20 TaxID=1349819 RepID=UPI00071F9BB8|nr:hypothetical protein [Aureimonas sp. AU20]ALN73586.1 hypothetical protein M673_12730 [Aureimonas sp. AU20]
MTTQATVSNVTSTTLTKVYIHGESSADTKAEFEALTWTEIGDVTDMGEFGDEREEITKETFGRGRRIKRSGVSDAGALELEVLRNVFDPGQTIARNALKGGKTQAIKVVFDDVPPGGGTPTVVYCLGVILSGKYVVSGPNEMLMQRFKASLTGEPIEVPATSAIA